MSSTPTGSEDKTVHVVLGSGEHVAHTDPDCPGLKIGTGVIREKPRSADPNRRICARCQGDVETSPSDREYRKERTDRNATVLQTLREADEPLTRRDLEFEAHVSNSQATAALDDLEEQGDIERLSNERDGRRPLYQPAERAHLTPLETVALLTVIGAVLIVSLAIANGVIAG